MDRFVCDKELQLKDSGAVTAPAAGTVDGVDKVIDLGVGPEGSAVDFRGDLVIAAAALNFNDGNESYTITVQCADVADFSTGVANVTGVSLFLDGRYVLPFRNEGRNGRKYRYLRVFAIVAGTTPSIDYSCYVSKSHS